MVTIKNAETEAIQIKGASEGGDGRHKRERIQMLCKSRVP